MKTLLQAVREYMENTPEEELRAAWDATAPPPIPKGWLSLDEYPLPTDLCSSYFGEPNMIKVRFKNSEESVRDFPFGDPNIWTIRAKEIGITHWLNE